MWSEGYSNNVAAVVTKELREELLAESDSEFRWISGDDHDLRIPYLPDGTQVDGVRGVFLLSPKGKATAGTEMVHTCREELGASLTAQSWLGRLMTV